MSGLTTGQSDLSKESLKEVEKHGFPTTSIEEKTKLHPTDSIARRFGEYVIMSLGDRDSAMDYNKENRSDETASRLQQMKIESPDLQKAFENIDGAINTVLKHQREGALSDEFSARNAITLVAITMQEQINKGLTQSAQTVTNEVKQAEQVISASNAEFGLSR